MQLVNAATCSSVIFALLLLSGSFLCKIAATFSSLLLDILKNIFKLGLRLGLLKKLFHHLPLKKGSIMHQRP